MTKEEYLKKEKEIKMINESNIHFLRLQYANKNSKFKEGEFITHLMQSERDNSIFKINLITYVMYQDNIEILYSGYIYNLNKNKKTLTYSKRKANILESYATKFNIDNIKIID